MKFAPHLLAVALLAGCGKPAVQSLKPESSNWQITAQENLVAAEEFPEVDLRGYGKVSGKLWKTTDGKASLLEITCTDEEKAKLTQAKYLSDLGLLPGVTAASLKVGDADVHTRLAEGQGVITALRGDTHVFIGAAEDDTALASLLQSALGSRISQLSSQTEVEVPMWLDRWDRFGFRFYYRPWEAQPGVRQQEYDFSKEFEFAEANDRSGFLFWAGGEEIDTAEGLTNEAWWNWALKDTTSKKLPVAVNIMTGGVGKGWFFNRYRDQTMAKMPQFCGTFHTIANPYFGGSGSLSWNATTAKDAELALLQDIVSRAVQLPNVTSILEPHGELKHGGQDIFLEYGPVADATFQTFLEKRYSSISALNAAWNTNFTAWNEVRVPEVASFLGWNEGAFDLSGEWRIAHEPTDKEIDRSQQGEGKYSAVASKGAPAEWFSADFDDSTWPTVIAPGHDRTIFLPKSPAVYRRAIDIPQEWLAGKSRVWLYLWDLNTGTGDKVQLAINGEMVGQSTLQHAVPHWGALDVTKALRPGKNQITLRLPKGIIAYRVYLSPDEPRQYPNMAESRNAQWVDFADWIVHSRLNAVRRGMEMIRQVEPNRQITLMAPGGYEDGVKALAKKYGGNYHNTGYMGAFWADDLPAIMRGAQLPFSLEPGGPAKDLEGFKKQLGLYATEGLQGIDYFIHVGNIMWPPDLRKHFEDNLNQIKLLGKYHGPGAEVAALYSTRGNALTGYPWGVDYNTDLGAGYWKWNVRANLMGRYESDALTESSFDEGDAARYKVVIDTNTSIMDERTLKAIEEYVRNGGTFVTFVQTGRHTPTKKDAWPIDQLTGYRVTRIDELDREGNPLQSRTLRPAPGQDIFTGDWEKVRANGLTLEKVSPDVQDLMLWEDGSVAIGMRPLGKGHIIQVGCKFTGKQIPDRIEPSSSLNRPTFDARPQESQALTNLLSQILAWRHIPTVAATFDPADENIILRHFLTNSGLYNVWTLWNQSKTSTITGDIVLTEPVTATWGFDVLSRKKITFANNRLPVNLPPNETRSFLTPRHDIVMAPTTWFKLQRNWWKAVTAPPSTPLPPIEHRFSVDLGKDWAFKALAPDEDGSTFAQPGTDTSNWEKMSLGIWSLPDKKDIKRAILVKTFTVPETWTNGWPTLSLQSWNGGTFVDQGRIWLDGKLISDWSPNGVINVNPDDVLTPGSTHTLAVEIKGEGYLQGTRGTSWLWIWPESAEKLDLAGDWQPSRDLMTYAPTVPLPGPYNAMSLRRNVVIPAEQKDRNVLLTVDTTGRLVGVLVNGHWVRRFHHIIGTRFDLNITPWVKFGEENEIELVSMEGPTNGTVNTVRLDFHNPASYP